MKKTTKIIIFSLFIVGVFCVILPFSHATEKTTIKSLKKNPDSYWSETNKPIFYGATKITIKKGLISQFDIKDTRFRIFAKDFEDGDLTSKITYSGEVNVDVAGTYYITYKVTDSNNNESSLVVPVEIVDNNDAKINVERTLYTIPSVWNMDIAGFSRCNYGDRQILGIYLPANTSIKARILNSIGNVGIQMFANDSAIESSITMNKTGEWFEVRNIANDGISYDSVPVFTTSVMQKDIPLDKTFKIELEYDNSVKELNYYHENDNETNFRTKWRNDNNTYSIIENEVLTIVVPISDEPKLTNYYRNGFKTLDEHLSYYKQVVDKMDNLIGLDLNPEKLTDQNVRTKYLVKANIHGAGAAYYNGYHVGINSSSVASFFEMNWGGLHEIGHGYQGYFGKGELSLGEVANNILGHYIQMDKNIYYHNGDWLGKLSNIEDNKNNIRNEKEYNDIDVSTRLYALINLFDSLEGEKTYAKMFSWFRENVNNGTITNKNKNQDFYALSIADIYNINIITYLEAWKVNITPSVKEEIISKNYPSFTILKDYVNDDTLSNIMTNENLNLKYGLVTNDIYQKYNVTGNLIINLDIDDFNKLENKYLIIKDNKNIIKKVKITANTINIENLLVGSYTLQMPIINGYDQKYMDISIKENLTSTYTYTYTNFNNIDVNNYYYFYLTGTYNTIGYKLTFSNHFTKAKIEMNGASFSNISTASVKIYDNQGNIISEEVKGYDETGNLSPTGIYFNYSKGSYLVDLQPGYIIEITHSNINKVIWKTTLNDSNLTTYKPKTTTQRYKIIENGILMEGMSEEEAKYIAYQELKNKIISILDNYKTKVTPEELNNRNINFKEKSQIVFYYNQLNNIDKTPYQELINKVICGGIPSIKYIGQTEYLKASNINLYKLIEAYDNEDENILIDDNNTTINTSINFNIPGTYKVIYNVKDSDNNISTYEVNIIIKDNTSSVTPSPVNPEENDQPVTPNEPEENNKPLIPNKPEENNNPVSTGIIMNNNYNNIKPFDSLIIIVGFGIIISIVYIKKHD